MTEDKTLSGLDPAITRGEVVFTSPLEAKGKEYRRPSMSTDVLRKRLGRAGAWLFAVGMVTGLWAAVVLTEKVEVPIPRLALAAHLNAILGAFWLIAVASTLDLLRYAERGRTRLAWLVALAAWANWLITLIASVLGVRGLEYTSDAANNVIAALLELFVVVPSLLAAAVWAWGFGERR